MKTLAMAVLALALGAGCGSKESTPTKDTNTTTAGGNPITAPVDYLGAVAKAQKSAVKVVDLASVDKAIQMFNAEEERFPKDLNELVTKKFLPVLPTPPTGMKFDYDAASGKVRMVKQ